MGMSAPKGDGGGMSEINVTPLIDIMLVLLIIFMVITPPTVTEMAANLPSNEKTEVPPDDVPKDQLVASVCKDGSFALNKNVMTLDELATQVSRRIRSKAKKVVFVDAHPDAPYNEVVSLMDRVRDAGAERVGLAKLKEADEFRSCSADPAPDAPAGEEATPG